LLHASGDAPPAHTSYMISLDADHDMSKGSGTYMGNMLLEAYDVTGAFVRSRAQLLIHIY
jgi:hypothetical protein